MIKSVERVCILCEGRGWRYTNKFKKEDPCFYCGGSGKLLPDPKRKPLSVLMCERGEHTMDVSRGVCCFCGPSAHESVAVPLCAAAICASR